jgi:STE24 endopeptidase
MTCGALVLLGGLDARSELGADAVPPADAWRVAAWDPAELLGLTTAELALFHERSAQRRTTSVVGTLAGLAFYVAFLVGPLSPRLARSAAWAAAALGRAAPFRWRWLRRIGRGLARAFGPDWASSLLFTYGYLGAGVLVGLPFWITAEALDRQAGLSRYTTTAWVVDLVRGEALAWAGASLLVFGLFGLVRRAPRRWWLLVGAPAALLLVAQGLLSPSQVRLVHRVAPLEHGPLRDDLARLARSQGFELSSIRVVEASRVTARLDARLLGIGPTRELLLFDTLIESDDRDLVVAAVAHELAHASRSYTAARYSAAALALLALLWMLSRVLLHGAPRLGLAGPGDVRALPLVMLAASLLFLAARPARLALARHEERLADRAALTMTTDPEAFVRLHLALARTNQVDLDPSPLAVVWFASHPTTRERVGTALWYREWLDEPAQRTAPEQGGDERQRSAAPPREVGGARIARPPRE